MRSLVWFFCVLCVRHLFVLLLVLGLGNALLPVLAFDLAVLLLVLGLFLGGLLLVDLVLGL